MTKTKIDDLPKAAEEIDAEEQKAAKGGAAAVKMAAVQASQLGALAAKPTGTIAAKPGELDTTIAPKINR
jgi:hypothetical protein